MEIFAKFRAIAAAIGFGNACLYSASRLLPLLFGQRVRIVKYYFMSQPVAPRVAGGRAGSRSFTLQWAGPDSPLFAQIERPASVIAARFAQGARCLVATVAGSLLAGCLWFVIGPYEEDEVRACFLPRPRGEAAWDFDVTVMPRYRMGRLFSYLWERASNELAGYG